MSNSAWQCLSMWVWPERSSADLVGTNLTSHGCTQVHVSTYLSWLVPAARTVLVGLKTPPAPSGSDPFRVMELKVGQTAQKMNLSAIVGVRRAAISVLEMRAVQEVTVDSLLKKQSWVERAVHLQASAV